MSCIVELEAAEAAEAAELAALQERVAVALTA